MHYNVLAAGPEPDLTRVEMKLDDTVDKTAMIQPWANPNWLDSQLMKIPAGEADVTHSFERSAPDPSEATTPYTKPKPLVFRPPPLTGTSKPSSSDDGDDERTLQFSSRRSKP